MWAPGPVWTSAENLTSTGTRSSDRPVRSESPYRLSYRSQHRERGHVYKRRYESLNMCRLRVRLAVWMSIIFFRGVVSCSPVNGYRRFVRVHDHHLQGLAVCLHTETCCLLQTRMTDRQAQLHVHCAMNTQTRLPTTATSTHTGHRSPEIVCNTDMFIENCVQYRHVHSKLNQNFFQYT